jgi:ABC-type molybdate transport system substrate-binding protein
MDLDTSVVRDGIHCRLFALAPDSGLRYVARVLGCGWMGRGLGWWRREGGQEEGSTMAVLAACSLTDAFEELESMFDDQNQGADATMSFTNNSGVLVQIRQARRPCLHFGG